MAGPRRIMWNWAQVSVGQIVQGSPLKLKSNYLRVNVECEDNADLDDTPNHLSSSIHSGGVVLQRT